MKISPISNMMLANIDSPEFFGDLTVPEPLVSDNDTSPATKLFVENATKAYSHYYRNCYNIQTIATNQGMSSSLIFDTSGNLYWSVQNFHNGTTYNLTSYVYKITPNGTLTTFASVVTYGAHNGSLAFDTSGNLYWAIHNYLTASNHALTSYVYKITPAGTMTTFASVATSGAANGDLIFDTSGNLYWSVPNYVNSNGTIYTMTSYVYKITSSGTLTTFASVGTNGSMSARLKFDTSGNLYWAISNRYSTTSYVYKITPAGSMSTFASVTTSGATGSSIVFDTSGNLYWSIINHNEGVPALSYIYKITSAGVLTVKTSASIPRALNASLIIDENANLYWAIGGYYNANTSSWAQISYIYKITPTNNMSIFASQSSFGTRGIDLLFDNAGNLYWAQLNQYNGSTGNLNSYLHVMTKHSIE